MLSCMVAVVTGANRGIGREVWRRLSYSVSTDMGGRGGRPVGEGAESVLQAVDLADGGPTGGFFRDGRPLAW